MRDVNSTKQIEIFRTGTHMSAEGAKLTFTETDLQSMAGSYDPALHEAPIVVGHPAHDLPAYGWVSGLAATGDQLVATADQVDPAFAELVAAGKFKKISASFYAPGSASNPKPEGYYLRHVGFLGAQPPAVKGLKAVEFNDSDEKIVSVEFGEVNGRNVANILRGIRDILIEKFGQEDADRAVPVYRIEWLLEDAAKEDQPDPAYAETDAPSPEEEAEDMKTAEEIAAEKAELERKTAEFAEREKKLAEGEASFAERAARASSEAFVAAQVAEGRVLPAEQAGLVDFMARLDDAETVSFAEGDGKADATMRKRFEGFVSGLPKRVDFSEIAGGDSGDEVDQADPVAISNAAVSFQEQQKAKGITVSIDAAVRHVTSKDS